MLDHILFWPVQLRGGVFRKKASVREWGRWIEDNSGGNWKQVDPLDRGMNLSDEQVLPEFLYFHPFVRDILFSEDESRSMQILARQDIKAVRVTLKQEADPVILEVRRMHLHLFETKIAVLATEFVFQQNVDLEKTEELLDYLRRAYPPYYDKDIAGHCPHEVAWLDGLDGKQIGDKSDYDKRATHVDMVRKRCAPVSAHWAWALKPLRHSTTQDEDHPSWRQVGDERMPSMTFLAHENPKSLTTQEFVRLTLLDAGRKDTLPYGTTFLQEFERKYCYDRYWDWRVRGHSWMTTRYCCCGYHFLVAGDSANSFFMNDKSGLLFHFRHHYFQIGLFVHMQHATLLMFLEDLYDAMRRPSRMERSVQDIQFRFARFTSGIWFTELTPQVQGRELYELWMREMGTLHLYEEVKTEIALAHNVLASHESRVLNRVATVLAPVTLVAGLFGIVKVPDKWMAWLYLKAGLARFDFDAVNVAVQILTYLFCVFIAYRLAWRWLSRMRSVERG